MKVACMQPYFLPYVGYWQLIKAVDKFVILDDVQYITRGWVNRNKIFVNGKENWITIPLKNANRNRMINEIEICDKSLWLPKFERSILYNFRKSPNFEEGYQILKGILNFEKYNLSDFLVRSIKLICESLEIKTKILMSSNFSSNKKLKGQEMIINICKQIDASEYVNLSGGLKLYDRKFFNYNKINLNFIKSNSYFQYLSIIELILSYDFKDIKNELPKYEINTGK